MLVVSKAMPRIDEPPVGQPSAGATFALWLYAWYGAVWPAPVYSDSQTSTFAPS